MGASSWERLTRVIIPAVRPSILGGVRMALGTAWIALDTLSRLLLQGRSVR